MKIIKYTVLVSLLIGLGFGINRIKKLLENYTTKVRSSILEKIIESGIIKDEKTLEEIKNFLTEIKKDEDITPSNLQ